MTFTAAAVSGTTLDALRSQLPTSESVLSGWMFAADGYTEGNPVYLSFKVGAGYPSDELDLWHYDGNAWTKYAATDLTCDGTYASFTVTGFSGYAVTAVPEPGACVLLAAGLFGLLTCAWRRRNRG